MVSGSFIYSLDLAHADKFKMIDIAVSCNNNTKLLFFELFFEFVFVFEFEFGSFLLLSMFVKVVLDDDDEDAVVIDSDDDVGAIGTCSVVDCDDDGGTTDVFTNCCKIKEYIPLLIKMFATMDVVVRSSLLLQTEAEAEVEDDDDDNGCDKFRNAYKHHLVVSGYK
jgi:hypothetical protein